MKMLLERWNKFVKESNYQDEFQQELLGIAMKIKDMMPTSEVFNMPREAFKDLVASVYEKHYDQTGEGWEPYDEDLETILDHLSVDDEEEGSFSLEEVDDDDLLDLDLDSVSTPKPKSSGYKLDDHPVQVKAREDHLKKMENKLKFLLRLNLVRNKKF